MIDNEHWFGKLLLLEQERPIVNVVRSYEILTNMIA